MIGEQAEGLKALVTFFWGGGRPAVSPEAMSQEECSW